MSQEADSHKMSYGEFVALMAFMTSLAALSIDAMLPALAQIGADLGAVHANDNQLIISVLFLGFAIGQIPYGPLSDSFGRKPAAYLGFFFVILGFLISIFCTTFSTMLIGRFIQGMGLAAPRIISVALIRDQYKGDEMAKVMSFVMSVFILIPTVAPAFGQAILLIANWRMIFGCSLFLTLVILVWFRFRQEETLNAQSRTPFSIRDIANNMIQICLNPIVLGYVVMSGLVFSGLLGYLNSVQQIFQVQYELGTLFPLYFSILALSIGGASFINGKLVLKYGMRNMSSFALIIVCVVSAVFFVISYYSEGHPSLWSLMLYLMIVLFCLGILMGNLNSLAMEPLGELAGIGASVVGALSTFISVPFGMLIGQSYDNTVLPLILGFAVSSVLALFLMYRIHIRELKGVLP